MSNLTTKQKIILGGVVGVMITIIGIYGYSTLHDDGKFMDMEGNAIMSSDKEAGDNEVDRNSEIQGNVDISNESLGGNERRNFKNYSTYNRSS